MLLKGRTIALHVRLDAEPRESLSLRIGGGKDTPLGNQAEAIAAEKRKGKKCFGEKRVDQHDKVGTLARSPL